MRENVDGICRENLLLFFTSYKGWEYGNLVTRVDVLL